MSAAVISVYDGAELLARADGLRPVYVVFCAPPVTFRTRMVTHPPDDPAWRAAARLA
ncbi:hypothetical protein [Streptomyces sp. NRRL S-31]|uniref:hypothetical protein n=1 Tax=Streptomyces sp. NRRL S-31 TaxID=1463898 RepID=UPI00131D1CF5|nr:hypothetical protein [Streptomyces sp. NRRL S-31]